LDQILDYFDFQQKLNQIFRKNLRFFEALDVEKIENVQKSYIFAAQDSRQGLNVFHIISEKHFQKQYIYYCDLCHLL